LTFIAFKAFLFCGCCA